MKSKKKNTGKKLNEICIIAFILSVRVICSASFTSGKAV